MSLTLRNKKVAIARWKARHDKEQQHIEKNNVPHLKARILGYLAGDGNVSIRTSDAGTHYSVRFFPDHESLLSPFKEAFIKVYGRKPIAKKDKNFYRMNIYSKPITLDILSCSDLKTHNWRVPINLLTDKQCKIEWIRAFFDAEAYVGPQHIKVHSVNECGLKDIKNLLLNDFGIKSKIYSYKPKNPKHNTQYQLMILSKFDRKKYMEKIGFNHKIKKDKLLNYLK